ncbi:glycosyltransferase family 1 protein [Nonomuraea sp. NPDC026600]|uniref:glycosyltransferase family 1 protein n=1 Tax=Nonomuraea sp. NPDC026600 TaxID=3155363 RepID=UPI0033E0D0E6
MTVAVTVAVTAAVPVLLVERNAHRVAGHHHAALIALARQARAEGRDVVVAAPDGITADTAKALHTCGAVVVTGAGGDPVGAVLLRAGLLLSALSHVAVRLTASRRWPRPVRRFPHQLMLGSRCLTEAAALRAGAGACAGARPLAVVLTAAEGLHALVAVLSGVGHLRFVHEVDTTEDGLLRLLGAAVRRRSAAVVALCPTRSVQAEVKARFPYLDTRIAGFALADPDAYIPDAERVAARARLGVRDGERVLCLVGGWWAHKDIATVERALALATRPLHLLAAGSPMDAHVLQRIDALPHVVLHTRHRELPAAHLREVYAAADAAIVARTPTAGKESGLVADAANHGVALLVSTPDADLAARLRGRPWARVLRVGDAAELAAALDGPLPARPHPGAAAELGLMSPAAALAHLTATAIAVADDITARIR